MSDITFCPSCGTQRRPGGRFCGSCGIDLDAWEAGFASGGSDTPAAADDPPPRTLADPSATPDAPRELVPSEAGGWGVALPTQPQELPATTAPQIAAVDRWDDTVPTAPARDSDATYDARGAVDPRWDDVATTQRTPAFEPRQRRRQLPFVPILIVASIVFGGIAWVGSQFVLDKLTGSSASVAPSATDARPSAAIAAGSLSPNPTATAGVGPTPEATPTPEPSSASPAPQAPSGWVSTAPMSLKRWGSAAVVLSNGDVLVVGGSIGENSRTAVDTSEIYHVASGKWEVVAPMHQRRSLGAAVRLADGRVLVFGGSADQKPLKSAETFDPAINTWTLVGSMAIARTDFSAVLMSDGRVMAIGGGSGSKASSVTATAEIYDPTTLTWTRTGSMASARAYAAAVSLDDGSVLVIGGRTTYFKSGGRAWATAERWDPTTTTWQSAGAMSTPRYSHKAVVLPSGAVLVTGGWPDTGSAPALSSAEIFEPDSNSWSMTASMGIARAEHVMVALHDGRVLVAGGMVGGSSLTVTATTELFESSSATWKDAGLLKSPVRWPVAVLISGGRVLIAGGTKDPGAVHSTSAAEVFDPGT